MKTNYSFNERLLLWLLAFFGFTILNSVFLYVLFFERSAFFAALSNPISLVFIIESFLIMAALAYLLSKWGVSKLHWSWFIILSLLGSMAFALPLVLLWPSSKAGSASNSE